MKRQPLHVPKTAAELHSPAALRPPAQQPYEPFLMAPPHSTDATRTPAPQRHWSDDFFDSRYVAFDRLRHNDADAEVKQALALASRLWPAGRRLRVTELCCGYGRLLIPLAQYLDLPPQGIDKSAHLLKEARRRARTSRVRVSIHHHDLRTYRGRNDHDVALLLATSFGYYGLPDDRRILASAHSQLRPGGILVLDQVNTSPDSDIRENNQGTECLLTTSFEPTTRTLAGRFEYLDLKTRRSRIAPFRIVLYTLDDLTQHLNAEGFHVAFASGALDGRPFRANSKRLVVVARRT